MALRDIGYSHHAADARLAPDADIFERSRAATSVISSFTTRGDDDNCHAFRPGAKRAASIRQWRRAPILQI